MSEFTPGQIQEILNIFFDNFAHRQYIGARYVPIFGRKDEESVIWDNTGTYEPLTVVLYQGNSYTSRQFVPIGIDILNQEYWANTGNYNAQVEAYRQEVLRFDDRIDKLEYNVSTPEMFGASGNGTTDDTVAIRNAIENSLVVIFDKNSTYLVSEPIDISNSILYGNNCTIKAVSSESRWNVFYSDEPFIVKDFVVTSVEDQIFVNGDNSYPQNGLTSNVEFIHTSGNDIVIENIKTKNISVPVYLEGSFTSHSKNVYVNNCHCVNVEFGIALSAFDDVTIENSHFTLTGNIPIVSHAAYVIKTDKNVVFDNCIFDASDNSPNDIITCHPSGLTPDTNYIKNVTFNNCKIIGNATSSMRLYFSENTVFNNCIIKNERGIIVSYEQRNGNVFLNNCDLEDTNTTYNAPINDIGSDGEIILNNCTGTITSNGSLIRGTNKVTLNRCNFTLELNGNSIFTISSNRNYFQSVDAVSCHFEGTFSILNAISQVEPDVVFRLINCTFVKKGTAISNAIYGNLLQNVLIKMVGNYALGYNNLEQAEGIVTTNIDNVINNTIL